MFHFAGLPEQYCQDPSTCGGGYEWGLMNFKDAFIFTSNIFVMALDWVLLAVYSVLLTMVLLKMVRFIFKKTSSWMYGSTSSP